MRDFEAPPPSFKPLALLPASLARQRCSGHAHHAAAPLALTLRSSSVLCWWCCSDPTRPSPPLLLLTLQGCYEEEDLGRKLKISIMDRVSCSMAKDCELACSKCLFSWPFGGRSSKTANIDIKFGLKLLG